jgi:phosphopentomutase
MKYGHRQDAIGYAEALNAFDAWLSKALPLLGDDDVLIVTADHGCDPTDNSTDHTREYVPFLMYGKSIESKNLGTISGFDHISRTVCELLENK